MSFVIRLPSVIAALEGVGCYGMISLTLNRLKARGTFTLPLL